VGTDVVGGLLIVNPATGELQEAKLITGNVVQNGCDSVSPASNPCTSLLPSAATPTATTTLERPHSGRHGLSESAASRNTYG
jgi:hypothetical protein